jgi:peptidyl-prolyl cis-trans isomerase B (cyclophilin B)
MKPRVRVTVTSLALLAVIIAAGCRPDVGPRDEVAVLETNYGRIVIDFLPDIAPRHVAHFKDLSRSGFYDGTKFFRIVRDDARRVLGVQAGDPNTISGDPSTWGQGQPGEQKVPAEFSSSYKHDRGTVTAARRDDPDSATSQFVICIVRESRMDGKYSAFGRVIDGMNVVDAIGRAPVVRNTDRPVDPVVVERVLLIKRDEALRGSN